MGKYVSKQIINLLSKNNIKLKKAQIAILGFSFKENIPDTRNTKVIQIVKELKKYNIRIKLFDSVVSAKDVKKNYNLKILKFNDLRKFKYDAIVMSVSHKIFLKNINYYDKYYKDKNKKIFVDLKNNYSMYDLKKNKFIFFQL
jgi:UDP-N-acetyl-D-galactosamine dehydrogenase